MDRKFSLGVVFFAATTAFSAPAQAALLNIDLGGLNGVLGSTLSGSFNFDTESGDVSNVAFQTFRLLTESEFTSGQQIGTGSFVRDTTAAFLFDGSNSDFLLEIRGGFQPDAPGIAPGGSQKFSAFANEGEIDEGFFLIEFGDTYSGNVTISSLEQVDPIPLPAGLPLLLAGLGGLAFLRRRSA